MLLPRSACAQLAAFQATFQVPAQCQGTQILRCDGQVSDKSLKFLRAGRKGPLPDHHVVEERRAGKKPFAIGKTSLDTLPAVLLAGTPQSGIETQYNQLFDDHNATVVVTDAECVTLPSDVAMASGSFIMPSLGQFGMGPQSMEGALDAFGKLSRFTVDKGRVCFAAQMMRTGFWNKSVELGSIAPGLLFYDTTPPRKNKGMTNLNAPNDNSYVNTMTVGKRFFGVTDSKNVIEFDPTSLEVLGDVHFEDNLDRLTVALGSAHPLPEPNSTRGCVLDVRPESVAMLVHEVVVYRVCDDAPTTRVKVATLHTGSQLPYFHSFGVAPRHAVLPLQHITFSMTKLMTGGSVGAAFEDYHVGQPTEIVLLPIDGTAEEVRFSLPGDVYFVHAINAFENATSVVFDATAYTSNNFANTRLTAWRDPILRDTTIAKGIATRFAMHVRGPRKGQVDITPLSHANRSTDFPKINWAYHTSPYCLFWAVEWFHDDTHMSRMAIVRQDVCNGTRRYWYREGSFPSEPTFVPRTPIAAGGPHAAEDDGNLMFTVLDGARGTSSLLFVDARTMETVAEAEAPKAGTIGYTTHGQWYEGVALGKASGRL